MVPGAHPGIMAAVEGGVMAVCVNVVEGDAFLRVIAA